MKFKLTEEEREIVRRDKGIFEAVALTCGVIGLLILLFL